MTDIARLGMEVDSSDVRSATSDLSRFGREGKSAAQSSSTVERSTSKMGAAFKGAAVQIAATVGAVATIQKTLGAADQYTNMQNRLLALGASHESAAKQIQQLGDIALATRAPLESTVELYSRLSLTSESLGASQSELMGFTETVGLALAASGTSAGEASGALTQLSQAMAGGVVRAEEFNSMIEGAPGLLMAVADGIDGVNGDLGALRQMMLDGELTSESFFNALLSQNEALQESFGNTAPTIASAFTAINNEFTLFVGSADQATGVTTTIAEAMLLLAENMEVAVPVFGAVAVGVATITAPILAAGVAIGALAVAVITHWDEIEQAFNDGVNYVVGLGSKLVQALEDAARNAVAAAQQLGLDIVAGIRQGITQKWDDLKGYVSGLGTGLVDGVKGIFETQSPSRVMMRIGDDVVEGLIIGIDDNTPRAVSHAEEMGRAVGQGVKDGLDPVLRTVFDGLAKGDFGSIGSGILGMAQQGFSDLMQTSFTKGGGGLSNVWEGITGAFTGIGDNYRAGGGGIAGIGSALSGLLPGIGAISSVASVVQSLVGTTTKLTNALEGTLGIGGLLRGTEYDIKQNDSMFGSSTEKNSEEIFGSWAGLIANDLDQEFRDMVQNTRDGIRALGLDIDDAFTYDFDVQFDESLPHEELMKRLRSELDKANDELLKASLAAAGLARDGETGAETLGILNQSLRTANASLRLLDQSLFDVSAIGAGAARELVEASGGMDAFASKTTVVFDNFLTEQEQNARGLQIANENLSATFGDLAGISIPNTHAQFVALMDAQDLTTAAGRETYAALLDVADEFVRVNGTAQEAADAVGNDLNPALEETGDTARDAAAAARELAAIEREREGLLLQIARATGNVGYIRQQELLALDDSTRALQEHIYMLEDQRSALQNALDAARDALTDAESAFDSAVNVLRGLVANAEEQLSAAEDAARRAFDAEKDNVSAEYAALIGAVNTAADDQIALAQEQVDAINAEREEAAERAAAQAVSVRDQISLLEGMLGSLDSALDNRRALTPEGRLMELAQAQAFLGSAVASGGTTDVDALEDALGVVADPSTDLFKSLEEYAFDYKVNTGFIKRLRDLTDDALSVEEKTLRELEAQTDSIEAQIDASREGLAEQIDAINAARDAEIQALEQARDDELRALDRQLNTLLGIDDTVLSIDEATAGVLAAQELVVAANQALGHVVETGNSQIVATLGTIKTALDNALAAMQDIADAQGDVDDAQGAIDDFGGGSGISDDAAALLNMLSGIAGAGAATLLGEDAFGRFSEDGSNALLSNAGVAALSGTAQDVADAFADELGRNVDVSGLQFYVDELADAGFGLSDLARDLAGSTEAITGVIPGFAIPGVDTGGGGSSSGGGGSSSGGSSSGGGTSAADEIAKANGTFYFPKPSDWTGQLYGNHGVPISEAGYNFWRGVYQDLGAAATVSDFVEQAKAEGTYQSVPSYRVGTDYHPGGMARLHENEMVNLPRGTGVSTAQEVREAALERKRTNELLAEANERLRYLQDKERVQTRIMNDWNNNGTPGTREGAVVKTETAS